MSGTRGDVGLGVRRRRRPPARVVVPAVAIAAALVAGALALFQPWKLVVDETVDEAAPISGPSSQASVPPTAPSRTPVSRSPASLAPVRLAAGSFVSHEHATRGRAIVLQLPDGSRVLRLEALDTSNGPDLHVWLSDRPVVERPSGWTVFDDGAYVDLGRLKGNRGSQNYAIPAGVDLASLSSVSVWCARFRVSFGAASLASTGTTAP